VWQDFAFACALYPQSEDFARQVEAEIESVVRKLRNHPSIALWCGDNEVDMMYLRYGLAPEANRLNRDIVPRAVHRHDPYRAYIPSSPHLPPAAMDQPDPLSSVPEQHLWGPRGYYKGRFYTNHTAHFIGEIGYHGCPNVSSIARFISPESLWPWHADGGWNDEWQIHSVYHWGHRGIDRDRIALMADQISELFGQVPSDLHGFALASQIVQAEAKKFFIESTRLRKWSTSGILWWNVIDGWPQFSDAVVDYYFAKKLAYHYIRRSQRHVCMIMGEPFTNGVLPVTVCNDTHRDTTVQFRVADGETDQEVCSGEITVPAGENHQVASVRRHAGVVGLFLLEWTANGERMGNHYVHAHPPLSLDRYLEWLEKIARLDEPFQASRIAR